MDTPIARKTLPRRLELTLEALGKTPAEVHRATGISQSSLSHYINNRRPLTLAAAVKLCDAYGLTLDWLFLADPSGLPGKLHEKLAASEVVDYGSQVC